MLKIESVSKRFAAGNYGVKDFSLQVQGGVLGLLGPNGAGKSTICIPVFNISYSRYYTTFLRLEVEA